MWDVDIWELELGVVRCLNWACWAGDHGSVNSSFWGHGDVVGR